MDLTERTIESKTMFQGRIITVLLDTAGLPDGGTAQREVVLHPGGVAILALDEADNVALVRQYRYPLHGLLLELPAGKLDPGEDHRPAALRELSEETGLEAGELTYLGHIYASPGFCDEALHMYLARDLTRAMPPPVPEWRLPETPAVHCCPCPLSYARWHRSYGSAHFAAAEGF